MSLDTTDERLTAFLDRTAITLMEAGITEPTGEDVERAMQRVVDRDAELVAMVLSRHPATEELVSELARGIWERVNR